MGLEAENTMMTLFTQSCSGQVKAGTASCYACQCLIENKTLKGILTQIEEGVHESSSFAYHGFGGLQEIQ